MVKEEIMKRIFPIITSLFFIAFSFSAHGLDNKTVVGNYELWQMREMAGVLQLKSGQKYAAEFSYGAADWVEGGTWQIEGDEVVLQGGKVKQTNFKDLKPLLFPGIRFKYSQGKLAGTDPNRPIVFIDANKTPAGGKEAGEGRMKVKGKVLSIDEQTLVVKMEECLTFNVNQLSDQVIQTAKKSVGKIINVEIPFSAIISGGSCP